MSLLHDSAIERRIFSGFLTGSPMADLVEAAGITDAAIAEIETWDEYFRVMRPLMSDLDGDGRPDRYLLNLGEVSFETIRMLVVWKRKNPKIGGEIKLMSVPAFERGGRRTSSLGSTMISINKRSKNIELCWEMAKILYTSFEVAAHIYRNTGIVTAYKAHRDAPFYHEPDPFCSGQPSRTLFIEQIPYVPHPPASPYQNLAYGKLVRVMIGLRTYAEKYGIYGVEKLEAEALRPLQESQHRLQNLMERNVLLTKTEV